MALRPTHDVEDASLAIRARRQTSEAGRGTASFGTTTMFTNAHDLQVVDSTLTVVGGDVHNHHNHYHYQRPRDIWVILQLVPNFRDIYHDMLEKATPGTGMWLVKSDKFRVWLEPNGNIKIVWGSGIPGAGKTVLASIVIECLETLRKESGGAICVCYVYFRYSQREEVTVRDVLETLVKQTLERHPECQAVIERTYAQQLREGSQPTANQLLGLLRELAERMACTFYVLDALDEAPTKIQLAVVTTLASLNVKLFITSRPLKNMEGMFPQAHTMTVVAQDADLDLHIAKAIDESAYLQHLLDQEDPSLQQEIVSTIKENCGGMFLHASLQLEALCECISTLEVRQTLKRFPSRIEDVYLYTWGRILKQNAEHASLAKTALVWVLNSSRSMTVEELGRAVATCPDTHKFQAERVIPSDTLISLCRGLITVEEESCIVRLVHYTAKDTLEGLLRESFPHPNSLLAAVCMTHLAEYGFQNTTISSEEEFKAVLKKDPLLAYASKGWDVHARAGMNVDETNHRTAQFIKKSSAFPALTRFNRTFDFDILTPLHIIGLCRLPVSLIEDAITGDPNALTTVRHQTPLIVASQSGHDDLVARLVALPETQVNLVGDYGCSALMRAALAGYEGVVKVLPACPGIQVNLADNEGWSALISAAYRGHGSVVQLLLQYPGIQARQVGNHGSTALLLAAEFGHNAAVEHILTTGAFDINAFDNDGDTAIKMAAERGHEAVVRMLLDAPNVDITIRSMTDGHTAMLAAQANGHSVIVELLRGFEARRTVNGSPTEIGQLSLLHRTEEESSGANNDEACYDAEEGERKRMPP